MTVVGLVVVALGAGVAAQTTPQESTRPPLAAAVVPHDSAETVAPSSVTPAPSVVAALTRQNEQPAQEPASATQEQQSPPAEAQEPQQAQAPPPVNTAQELLTPEERAAVELVERLIREQEGVLMGTGFDYSAAGRRDPFRSLLAQLTAVSAPTVRPFGLPGFLISEVELKAIAAVQGRWHAMVTAPDQRAYFLEVGTELFDGHVMQIGPGEVLFEQVVPDLTGARRTRQVTKRLRTTDGGGETP